MDSTPRTPVDAEKPRLPPYLRASPTVSPLVPKPLSAFPPRRRPVLSIEIPPPVPPKDPPKTKARSVTDAAAGVRPPTQTPTRARAQTQPESQAPTLSTPTSTLSTRSTRPTRPILPVLPTLQKPAYIPSPIGSLRSAVRPTTSSTRPTTSSTRPSTSATNITNATQPMTSSTRRLSFASMSTARRRPIKYGSGKHARVELVPQPSDDDEDPLNWPAWKKEAAYWTLLLVVALVGVEKTALVSINARLAADYAVPYAAAAALTGVPLLLSAVGGLASLAAARVWGRRPLYLAAAGLLVVGSLWNVNVAHSYGQCLMARLLQGLAWGAVDVLVLGSVHDVFFEHDHPRRIALFDLVDVGATWMGGPLLGGAVSAAAQSADGRVGAALTRQYAVLGSLVCVAALAVALAVPETVYDRAAYVAPNAAQTPGSAWSATSATSAWSQKQLPLRPRGGLVGLLPSRDDLRAHLRSSALRPVSYERSGATDITTLLLQAPRALMAPTTLLLALLVMLPLGAFWGLAASLGLLFAAPRPADLGPGAVGALLTAPWLVVTTVVVAMAMLSALSVSVSTTMITASNTTARLARLWPAWQPRRFGAHHVAAAIASGSLLSLIGLLAFGLYVATASAQPNLPGVSVTLGLVAAGVYLLDALVRPIVRGSAQFTGANLAVVQRTTVDMCGAVAVWRAIVAGAFAVGLPGAVSLAAGLRSACVGLGVTHLFVAAAVAGAWWRADEAVRRLDGRVLRCVDRGLLKRSGSFFDTD